MSYSLNLLNDCQVYTLVEEYLNLSLDVPYQWNYQTVEIFRQSFNLKEDFSISELELDLENQIELSSS